MNHRIEPVRLSSGFTTIALDWLVYAATMGTAGAWAHAWGISTLVGSALTLLIVTVLEGKLLLARQAWLRGLVAALAVAAPLPLLGTVVGLAGVAWALSAGRRESRS